jgi:hypothetical protein
VFHFYAKILPHRNTLKNPLTNTWLYLYYENFKVALLVDFRAKIHCAIVFLPSVKQQGQLDIAENWIFKILFIGKVIWDLGFNNLSHRIRYISSKKSINYADNDIQVRLGTYFGAVYTLSEQFEFNSTTHQPSALNRTLCYQTRYIFV